MRKGQPSPDMPGVLAGKAADMHVIAPSIPKRTAEFSAADEGLRTPCRLNHGLSVDQ